MNRGQDSSLLCQWYLKEHPRKIQIRVLELKLPIFFCFNCFASVDQLAPLFNCRIF